MSSPMMTRMFGFCADWADAGVTIAEASEARRPSPIVPLFVIGALLGSFSDTKQSACVCGFAPNRAEPRHVRDPTQTNRSSREVTSGSTAPTLHHYTKLSARI